MFVCKKENQPSIYINGGKVKNKVNLDQEFDVTPGTVIYFRKQHWQKDDPMIEFCVIEIDGNENVIERETQTQTTNKNIDSKIVAFATTVPVTIGDVDVDGANEEVLVINDTIVRSLEFPTASRSAQKRSTRIFQKS